MNTSSTVSGDDWLTATVRLQCPGTPNTSWKNKIFLFTYVPIYTFILYITKMYNLEALCLVIFRAPMGISGSCRCCFGSHFPDVQTEVQRNVSLKFNLFSFVSVGYRLGARLPFSLTSFGHWWWLNSHLCKWQSSRLLLWWNLKTTVPLHSESPFIK